MAEIYGPTGEGQPLVVLVLGAVQLGVRLAEALMHVAPDEVSRFRDSSQPAGRRVVLVERSQLAEPVAYDAALLVVDAATGLDEQHLDELRALQETGLRSLAVFIDRWDRVHWERLDEVEKETRELLQIAGFSDGGTFVVRGSSSAVLEDVAAEENIRTLLAVWSAAARIRRDRRTTRS